MGGQRWLVTTLMFCFMGCQGQTAEQHLERAEQYRQAGEGDAAIIELKNALQKIPGLTAARLALGDLLFSAGQNFEALNAFERAAATGTPDVQLRGRKMLVKIRLQRAADVVSDLAGAGSLTAAEQAVLGLARLSLGDSELAQQNFEAALQRDSELAYAHFGLGQILWRAGNAPRAATHFERAVALEQDDPEIWLVKAEFEFARRELDRARADFSAATALPGHNLQARLGEARLLLLEG